MTTIVNGMDTERMEEFRHSLETDSITLGLEVTGTWEGHSGRSIVHIGRYRLNGETIERPTRHYTVSYGAWKEVEEALGFVGPTDRAEPIEMALGAMAACLAKSVALNAPRHGIELQGLEIKVSCEVDPSVLFEVKGPEDHTSCMSRITTDVKVKGDLSDEQMDTIRRLLQYSPVHGLVAYANRVDSVVERA